ncbi:hypothetical protein D3C71_1132300 [compost metagenome]
MYYEVFNETNKKSTFTSYREATSYIALKEPRGTILVMYDDFSSMPTGCGDIVDGIFKKSIENVVEELLALHSNIIAYSDNYDDDIFGRMLFLGKRMECSAPLDFESERCIAYMEEVKNVLKIVSNSKNKKFKEDLNNLSDKADSIITAIILCYGE